MPLSFRLLPSLLLLALMGASVAAVAGPRQKVPHETSAAPPPRAAHEPAPRQLPRQGERPQPRAERPAPSRSTRHDDALSDSVRRIERSTRGEVLSAERVPYDGRDLNRIKVVDERGRVRVYMDDPARSGSGQPQAEPPAPTRGDDD